MDAVLDIGGNTLRGSSSDRCGVVQKGSSSNIQEIDARWPERDWQRL
jgi:hypothetical protein